MTEICENFPTGIRVTVVTAGNSRFLGIVVFSAAH